jgi:phage terminase large subunit-like protein
MTTATKDATRRAELRANGTRRSRRAEKLGIRVSSSGIRFGLFCFTYLRQTKGRWAKMPLSLELWQAAEMSELLKLEREEWLELEQRHLELTQEELWAELKAWRLDHPGEGLRVYREGLLGIPKKNGKSTIGSGMALYLLVGDEEQGAEIYSTASVKDQAKIVFRQAKEMVEKSPRLLDRVRLYRDSIEYPDLEAFYKVVSADAGAQEGINPHGIVNDELHAHKKRDLYDTLRSATIARDQPLLLSITTGGIDVRDTICGELYRRGAGARPRIVMTPTGSKVKPRKGKQSSFFFSWYEAKRDTIASVLAANPASWITEAKIEEESGVERPRAIFLRYHGNKWVAVEHHFFPPGHWARCRGKGELERGDGVIATIDVGTMYDTTAIIFTRPANDEHPRKLVRARIIGVHPDPAKPPPPVHRVVEGEGPLDMDDDVLAELELFVKETGVRLIAVGADPMKFEDQLSKLDKRGIVTVRFDQGAQMVDASETLYRDVGRKLLEHDGDPILEAHMDNAAARDVAGGRFRLDKKRASAPMDGSVGTAMGCFLANNEELIRASRPSFTVLA